MPGSLGLVPDGFHALEVVIALIAGLGEERPLPSGSGVIIGPGLALTAKHVLDDYWDQFDADHRWRRSEKAPFAIQAIQYVPRLDTFIRWDVWASSLSKDLDIAVLQIAPSADLPKDYEPVFPELDLATPEKGTEIQAFGFPFPDLTYDEGSKGWVLSHSPAGSVGTVTQTFPEGRERTKPYPAFEMDIEVKGGMSGGPVFDSRGYIRGILCSSFDFAEPGPHCSLASSLWPACGLGVVATENLGIDRDGHLLDVANAGRIRAHNVPQRESNAT